jgi:hypothetical protein
MHAFHTTTNWTARYVGSDISLHVPSCNSRNCLAQLELSMEVIDDYFNEAKQVHDHNPWLNYATPLHRCREMGFSPREFDLLDERKLIKDELLVFVGLLFGRNMFQTAPDIHSDWKAFVEFLQSVLDNQGDLFNPLTLKTA